MLQNKSKTIFWLFRKLVYLAMFGLGVYFIYQGDVMQRFYRKRTNFATYEEDITELPSIVTWILAPNQYLKFAKDFRIVLTQGAPGSFQNTINLKYGKNIVPNSNLAVDVFDPLPNSSFAHRLQITPHNFTVGMPLDHEFSFILEESAPKPYDMFTSSIYTTNGSLSCNSKLNDGLAHGIGVRMGHSTKFIISAQKTIHLKEAKNCRLRPYTEEFNEVFSQTIVEMCDVPCRHSQYVSMCKGLVLSNNIQNMPVCNDGRETKCFDDVYAATLERINEQACTTLHFTGKQTALTPLSLQDQNKAVLQISFDPPQSKVVEEYLIYDFVAMISSIGGTMSLCIGFSFDNFISTLSHWLEYLANHNKSSRKVNSAESGLNLEDITKKFARMEGQITVQTQSNSKLERKLEAYEMRLSEMEKKIQGDPRQMFDWIF